MFTGIIQSTAKVVDANLSSSGMLLRVSKPKKWKIKLGDSISVNGVCSTVAKVSDGEMTFEYMPETLKRTSLAALRKSSFVNLEQSLRASDRLDGHIVQGHVDTIGRVIAVTKEGNSRVVSIEVKNAEKKLMRLIAEKGAIAIDGISLTVVAVFKNYFTVKIIPHTLEHTNIGAKKTGAMVNLEFDILAKYLQRLIK